MYIDIYVDNKSEPKTDWVIKRISSDNVNHRDCLLLIFEEILDATYLDRKVTSWHTSNEEDLTNFSAF